MSKAENQIVFNSLRIKKSTEKRVTGGRTLKVKSRVVPACSFAEFVLNRVESNNVNSNLSKNVVTFFRDVFQYMDQVENQSDFHTKIQEKHLEDPNKTSFYCLVVYGDENRIGRRLRPRKMCISCELGQNQVSDASFIRSTQTNRCWIDAKGRPYYIITPIRHVESFTNLSDLEIFQLYFDAFHLLFDDLFPSSHSFQEADCSSILSATTAQLSQLHFVAIVVNFGGYRNLEHLHLKAQLSKQSFISMQANWSHARFVNWTKTLSLASDPSIMSDLIGGTFRDPR